MKWYEKLQKQCKSCKKYLAEDLIKQDDNWFYWRCKFCGAERRHERSWGIYRHKKGKVFLKTKDVFEEVELQIIKGLPKIVFKRNHSLTFHSIKSKNKVSI